MKKLMATVFVGFAIVMTGLLGLTTYETVSAIDAIKSQEARRIQQEQQDKVKQFMKITEIPSDVYSYRITEVNGDEVNGLAITKKSFDNNGIVLSKEYNDVDLEVGDIIVVTYGEAFDDIKSVKIIN